MVEEGESVFRPNEVLLSCLSVLKDDKPLQETPLSYFYKVVTFLCYQKPKEVSHLSMAVSHFYIGL